MPDAETYFSTYDYVQLFYENHLAGKKNEDNQLKLMGLGYAYLIAKEKGKFTPKKEEKKT